MKWLDSRPRLAWFLTCIAFFAASVNLFWSLPGKSHCNDFAAHYLTSRLFYAGQNPYGVELKPHYEARGFVYEDAIHTPTNPPTLTAFFGLFCFESADLSFTLWILFQTCCLIALLEMMRRQFFAQKPLAWLVMVTIVLISEPILQHYQYGQVQLFLVLLAYGGYYCLQRSRFTLGCLLVAFAGVLKLYPFVLLPWFVMQGDDPLPKKIVRGICVLGVSLIAMLSFGTHLWADFATHAMPVITKMAATFPSNNSVPATLQQLSTALYGFNAESPVRFVASLIGLSMIAVSYTICFFRSREKNESQISQQEFGFMLMAMIAGGATAWMHYYTFLLFPFLWLCTKYSTLTKRERKILIAGLLVVVIECDLASAPTPMLKVLAYSLPTFALVAFYVVFANRLLTNWDVAAAPLAVEMRNLLRLPQASKQQV